MSSSRKKQETDSVKWTKNHGFQELKRPGMQDLSVGQRGRTTGSPTA